MSDARVFIYDPARAVAVRNAYLDRLPSFDLLPEPLHPLDVRSDLIELHGLHDEDDAA